MRRLQRFLRPMLALLLGLASAHCPGAEKLKLGFSDVENFPYQSGNGVALGDPPGIAVELIRIAAQELGFEVEFVRLPAVRLFVSMQSNEIQGAFLFSYKEDRLQYGSYPMRDGKPDRSRRMTTMNYTFYKMHDSPLKWNGSELLNRSMPVGINSGFSIGDDLKKLGIPVDDGTKATAQNMSKLQHGRISAYATLEDSADAYLERHQVAGVVKLQPPITSRDYYLMFSKRFTEQNPALAEQIWTRLGVLRDKRSAELAAKYLQ